MTLTSKDRSSFTPADSVREIWEDLRLPEHVLQSLSLPGDGPGLPSSFRVGHIAQASIALSALAAALIHSALDECSVPKVSVSLRHACAEFKCERLYSIFGVDKEELWGPVGGLHQTSDGHVRIHDGFPHHRSGALKLLGLDATATRGDVARASLAWKALDLEKAAINHGLVIVALRSCAEWDALPQASAISDSPICLTKLADGAPGMPSRMRPGTRRALQGLRVLELSRVIAAPVAGKTLAQHGADVLWVTSPSLPDQPVLDREFSRGKRSIRLDLAEPADKARAFELVREADVFLQSYRPGSLAARGFGPEDLIKVNPNIIYASLCAYGTSGSWADLRGFDSLVQTCSGMNVSEAEHYGDGSVAKALPCQALDHTAGFVLATGILAAVYKRGVEGGSYAVDVSLAGCMKYLKSLGQYEGRSGFACEDIVDSTQVDDLMEIRPSAFGDIRYVRHSAVINGLDIGSTNIPVPLGSDEPAWQ